MQLIRIVLSIKKLDIILLKNLIERLGTIKASGSAVASKLVPSIEDKRQEATLIQIRMHFGKWWHKLPAEDLRIRGQQIVPVDGLQTHIVKKNSQPLGMNVRALWIPEQC